MCERQTEMPWLQGNVTLRPPGYLASNQRYQGHTKASPDSNQTAVLRDKCRPCQ